MCHTQGDHMHWMERCAREQMTEELALLGVSGEEREWFEVGMVEDEVNPAHIARRCPLRCPGRAGVISRARAVQPPTEEAHLPPPI